jgi:hypothetical protein
MVDWWEQQIVDASTSDGITDVAGVLPTGDYDSDGLSNKTEFLHGMNPIAVAGNIDGDSLPDAWEMQIINADPNDGINAPVDVLASSDFDEDGSSNALEFRFSTNPVAAGDSVDLGGPTGNSLLEV